MKTFFLSIILFLIVNFTTAQSQHIDSLKLELSLTDKKDTNRVSLLLQLSQRFTFSFPDSSLLYARQGLQLYKELNLREGEINFYYSMSEALATNGNFSKALDMSFKALKLAEKSGNNPEISWALIFTGNTYFYSGDYQNALMYYKKGKANIEKLQLSIKFLYAFIGESYFHLNRMDSALWYIQKSYDLDKKDTNHWCIPYFYLAHIHSKKEQFKEALGYYREGIRLSNVKADLIDGYIGIANVFKNTGKSDSSIYYANKAFASGQIASLSPKLIEASSLLTEIYTVKHNQDSAFKYQGIMLAMKDSLFSREKVKQIENLSFNEQIRQQEILAEQEQLRNKIKIFALLTGLFIVLLVAFMLWRNNQHKQKAYALLKKQKQETDIQKTKAEKTLEELRSTQSQLIQAEKMASLGELTAGIAHEIQNPLNFVNNFSEVNTELIDEMEQEINKGNLDEAKSIAKDIRENQQKINQHGKRADAIVKGMLQHSRTSSGIKELTNVNALADEYLRLAYHGLRAKDKSFNVTMKTDFDETIGKINVIPQDIGRVILNLITNAFYAVMEKKQQLFKDRPDFENFQGLSTYEPTVSVSTKKTNNKVEISVKDNGNGIPQKVLDKIFQPFFTTKPTGEGTGLGLSLAYDIVTKGHGGTIEVENKEGEGVKMIITIPV